MPQAGTTVRADIQGLRAVAVGLVVAYHAKVAGIPGGYVGVDVFYVISGFLITGLLLREVDRTGTVRLAAFYARRARRLLPAATVVIIATLAAAFVFLPPLRLAVIGTDAAAAALYVSNLRFAFQATDYLAADSAQSPFLHFWSLAVEEQFYLVWPGLILLVTRRGSPSGGRRVLPPALAIAIVFAASLAAAVYLTPRMSNWAFYASPPRAFEFAAGALVALAVPRLARLGRAPATALTMLGVALVALAAVRFDETTAFPGVAALLPVIGATLFIIGGTGATGPLERVWAVPVISRLGVLSYSLYLWHWPMLVLPEAVAGRSLTAYERWGSWRPRSSPRRSPSASWRTRPGTPARWQPRAGGWPSGSPCRSVRPASPSSRPPTPPRRAPGPHCPERKRPGWWFPATSSPPSCRRPATCRRARTTGATRR